MDDIFEYKDASGVYQTVLLKDIIGVSKSGTFVYLNMNYPDKVWQLETGEDYYELRDNLATALNPNKNLYYVAHVEGQQHYIKPENITGMVERFFMGNKQTVITTTETVYYLDGTVKDFLMSKVRLN